MSSTACSLQVSLFGGVRAAAGDARGTLDAVPLQVRSQQLLALLVLAWGHSRGRAELCRDLWDEDAGRPDTQSTCFSTALWRLRRSLLSVCSGAEQLVQCDRAGCVRLSSDGRVSTDLDAIRAALPLLAKPVAALQEQDVACMQGAVRSYRGDLLAGIESSWALRERETLRRHQLNMLGRLMQCCALAADVLGAIGYGQMVLDMDPLREDIHRELIRLYVLSGQRAQALMQFETCRDVLRRELAIPPMQETLALYQHIANAALGRGTAPPETRGVLPLLPGDAPALLPGLASRRPGDLLAHARSHLAAADTALRQAQPLLD